MTCGRRPPLGSRVRGGTSHPSPRAAAMAGVGRPRRPGGPWWRAGGGAWPGGQGWPGQPQGQWQAPTRSRPPAGPSGVRAGPGRSCRCVPGPCPGTSIRRTCARCPSDGADLGPDETSEAAKVIRDLIGRQPRPIRAVPPDPEEEDRDGHPGPPAHGRLRLPASPRRIPTQRISRGNPSSRPVKITSPPT